MLGLLREPTGGYEGSIPGVQDVAYTDQLPDDFNPDRTILAIALALNYPLIREAKAIASLGEDINAPISRSGRNVDVVAFSLEDRSNKLFEGARVQILEGVCGHAKLVL